MENYKNEGCAECGGMLRYSQDETLLAYEHDEEKLVVIPIYYLHDYLVYVCVNCELPVRLTYKQVEKMTRKSLALLRAKEKMVEAGKLVEFNRQNNNYLASIDKYKKLESDYKLKAIKEHNDRLNEL